MQPRDSASLDGRKGARDQVDCGVGSDGERHLGHLGHVGLVDEHDLCAPGKRLIDGVEQVLQVRPHSTHRYVERHVVGHTSAAQCHTQGDRTDHLPLDDLEPAGGCGQKSPEPTERVMVQIGDDRVQWVHAADVDRDGPVLTDGDALDAQHGLHDHSLGRRAFGQGGNGGDEGGIERELDSGFHIAVRQAANADGTAVRQLRNRHPCSLLPVHRDTQTHSGAKRRGRTDVTPIPCPAVQPLDKSPVSDTVAIAVDRPGRRGEKIVVWAARAVWLLVAVVGGAAIGQALSDHSTAVQRVGTVGSWVGWAAVAIAIAVPSTIGLTIVRSVVPAGVTIAIIASVAGAGAADAAVLIGLAVLMAALTGAAEFGQSFAQGSAYGHERRFVLRPPVAFMLPAAASWCVLCAAAITGQVIYVDGGYQIMGM